MQFTHDGTSMPYAPRRVIVAGWTGRDAAAIAHHIEELTELGVSPPSKTPLYYRVSTDLLTTAGHIQVLGGQTSGEAEPMVLCNGGEVWLGLASDHTDRELEAVSVASSKQACAKPCARELWRLEGVQDRLDRLVLRSWFRGGDGWTLYQDGTLAALLPLADLMRGGALADGDVMLCGTLPALGGIRPAPAFRAELLDPDTGRTIDLSYTVEELPVIA